MKKKKVIKKFLNRKAVSKQILKEDRITVKIKEVKPLPERSIYFIHGGIDAEEREEVRKIVESESNAIIVASYGTFSTGINIRNLHNVVFSSPTKSRVRTLQSIGRGLRTSETKTSMTLYDISDDMRYKDKLNFTAQHFKDRIVIYNSENFKHKVYNIDLT